MPSAVIYAANEAQDGRVALPSYRPPAAFGLSRCWLRHGARCLGADKDIGSIDVGKLAYLVSLNGNPLEKIGATADATFVMKGGAWCGARSLDQIWPRTVPFGPTYRVNDDMLPNKTTRSDVFDH